MGEIADAMLDGTLCQYCGVWIDDDIGGFPRSCGCEKEDGNAPRKKTPRTKTELDAYSVEQNRIQREGKAAKRREKRERQRNRQSEILALKAELKAHKKASEEMVLALHSAIGDIDMQPLSRQFLRALVNRHAPPSGSEK